LAVAAAENEEVCVSVLTTRAGKCASLVLLAKTDFTIAALFTRPPFPFLFPTVVVKRNELAKYGQEEEDEEMEKAGRAGTNCGMRLRRRRHHRRGPPTLLQILHSKEELNNAENGKTQ